MRLSPPRNSHEAIESRRNPCHGFAVIIDMQEYAAQATLFQETLNDILKIVDPDRDKKIHPIRSHEYIKQKYFHASVFGPTPWLDKSDFLGLFGRILGLLNKQTMDKICENLHMHLNEQQPSLEPARFEIMDDGTILARYEYRTKDKDKLPLQTLANQLDPEKKFGQWDGNPKRYQTITVALGVIDKDKMPDKIKSIQHILNKATQKLVELGNTNIEQFHFFHYEKRTLSLRHTQSAAVISHDNVFRV